MLEQANLRIFTTIKVIKKLNRTFQFLKYLCIFLFNTISKSSIGWNNKAIQPILIKKKIEVWNIKNTIPFADKDTSTLIPKNI